MVDDTTQELLDALTHVMAHASDPHVLKLAARSLARYPDPEAQALLTTFLRDRNFLGRLDEVTKPSEAMTRLRQVFEALRERPVDAVRRLCLTLGHDPAFVSTDERNWLLLETLAEIRPMDEDTVAFFEHTNQLGYSTINAPLLVHNGSPLALALFRRMIGDPEEEPEVQADTLHSAVLSNRTREPIVQMCGDLLGDDLPDGVSAAVVESLYDHRSREWFGPAINPPKPPDWESASTEALQRLIDLAPHARQAVGVSDSLAATVRATEDELKRILERKGS